MEFSIRLKEMREAKGISQAELAEKIGVGISTVGMWESTSRIPGAKTLQRLIAYFGCSVDYLLGRTDELGASLPASQKLPDDEFELLRLYRILPPEFRRSLLDSAKLWAGEPTSATDKKKA